MRSQTPSQCSKGSAPILHPIPDDKSILTAAKQILNIYDNDATDAKEHAAKLTEEFVEKGDVDGQLTWLKIHRAIIELTDVGYDGETVH